MFRWWFTHVIQKVFEGILPSLTNGYPSATIENIAKTPLIIASALQGHPCTVDLAFAHSVLFVVICKPATTSASLDGRMLQCCRSVYVFVSAVAFTYPRDSGFPLWANVSRSFMQYYQFSETSSDQRFFFHTDNIAGLKASVNAPCPYRTPVLSGAGP